MLQAAVCDGCTLDVFTLGKDYLGPVEVDVSRREVVQALVIADVVIVLDEAAARDRRAGNSSRVECGSSESGASVRSFPEFGDDTAPRAHAPCPYPRATWPDRRQRKTSHCLREALAGARR